MALFRRKAKDQAADEVDVTTEVEQDSGADVTDVADADAADEVDADEAAVDESEADGESDEDESRTRLPRPFDLDRSDGPFDRSEVKNVDGLLDFGAVAIAPQPGMELRLDVDDAGQEITGLTAVLDDAACQLQAFAAPKSRGVWDAIRDEIADNLLAGGGTAEEKLGPLGIELHTRMPTRGPDGRTTFAPARFVGVDGPRWFLRVVLSGNAAIDEAAGDRLLDFVRQTVITRGGEPRAPREMLPLQIPQDIQAQADAEAAADPNAAPCRTGDRSDTADDFKPFERGPEITEVR
ncbi:DUF3710 domain-containing protein [Flexivirga caeni]|uniref:DUF3710 domain-containing protein n=1 Tax=Flexivirga caeni TaxID=2294115 RepID=A0A3M9LZM3_9MICO|nr:DUF3710 domain-containing protein [Flexivirga caeni]RNI18375.1 DUF3710 domain-containing protein [Flexivirga caeni]